MASKMDIGHILTVFSNSCQVVTSNSLKAIAYFQYTPLYSQQPKVFKIYWFLVKNVVLKPLLSFDSSWNSPQRIHNFASPVYQ